MIKKNLDNVEPGCCLSHTHEDPNTQVTGISYSTQEEDPIVRV